MNLTCFVCAGFVQGFPYVWLLFSFLPALALSYTAKDSIIITKARLIWRWYALSACAEIKLSWMFRSG